MRISLSGFVILAVVFVVNITLPAQQPARTDLQLVIPDSTRLQVLELHNGERLIGRIVEIRDQEIDFQAGLNGVITLTTGEIAFGKNLTIQGPGSDLITISGNNSSRIFNITSGNVTISGLTLTGGLASDLNDGNNFQGLEADSGGAIFSRENRFSEANRLRSVEYCICTQILYCDCFFARPMHWLKSI